MPIRRVAVAIATALILLGPLVHPTIERFGLLASAAVLCITDMAARRSADLVVDILGRRVGASLWLLREVVPREVLLLLDRGDPLRRDLPDARPLVRSLSAQRSADRGGLGSDANSTSPHDPWCLGLGDCVAAAPSPLEQAASAM